MGGAALVTLLGLCTAAAAAARGNEAAPPPQRRTVGAGPFACARQDAACAFLGQLYWSTDGPVWGAGTNWSAMASTPPPNPPLECVPRATTGHSPKSPVPCIRL